MRIPYAALRAAAAAASSAVAVSFLLTAVTGHWLFVAVGMTFVAGAIVGSFLYIAFGTRYLATDPDGQRPAPKHLSIRWCDDE